MMLCYAKYKYFVTIPDFLVSVLFNFNFHMLHFITNICTLYSLHFQKRPIA